MNHTGYAQVLEERSALNSGPSTLDRSYTIGDDVLSQSDGTLSPATHFLGYDGHGSTRILTDAAGAIASGGRYNYDAYGVQLGSQSSVVSPALTSLLYTGEQFDTGLQQYYLRARYYNQSNGSFNQLDPFEGDRFDPPSLHKYAYVHNDPANQIDPSGRSIVEFVVRIAASLIVWVLSAIASLSAYGELAAFVAFMTMVQLTNSINTLRTGVDEEGESAGPLGLAMAALTIITAPTGIAPAAGGGKKLVLKFVEGMDKSDFLKKAKALQRLAKRGKLIKAENPVLRDSNVTQRYRRMVRERIERRWANDPAHRDQLLQQLDNMQVDHIQDLQLSGADELANLWLLDKDTNWNLGSQIWGQIRTWVTGDKVTEVVIEGL